jgi:hypothetical protein
LGIVHMSVNWVFAGVADVDQMNESRSTSQKRLSRCGLAVIIGLSLLLAVVCFVVVAILPTSPEPFFDSPLRSLLVGVGLLGVAAPLCIAGALLKRHAAGSPYFEEGFIAGVLNVFGYLILAVGVACLALAAYAFVHRLLDR